MFLIKWSSVYVKVLRKKKNLFILDDIVAAFLTSLSYLENSLHSVCFLKSSLLASHYQSA